jgi:hypothetical protein
MAAHPQARSTDLTIEPIGEEMLAFDAQRQVAHSLNGVAAAVWHACNGTRTVEQIATHCGLSAEVVALSLDELAGADLLMEATPEPTPHTQVSRRHVLRRAALTGAGLGLALPVIRSVTATTPALAAASTCGQLGQACCPSSVCASGGHCNSGLQCASRCQTGGFGLLGPCTGNPCCAGSACVPSGSGEHGCIHS